MHRLYDIRSLIILVLFFYRLVFLNSSNMIHLSMEIFLVACLSYRGVIILQNTFVKVGLHEIGEVITLGL